MEKKYTKLSNLVDSTFTVEKVYGYKWKMWDASTSKMLVSDVWQNGYKKTYAVETDKGSLDLSASQFGILLETISKNGIADLNGRTFQVKSNGKTGMDIRYFFNAVQNAQNHTGDANVEAKLVPEKPVDEFVPDDINLDDIVF